MKLTAPTVLLLGSLAHTGMGSHVFSHFFDDDFNTLGGNKSFDVGNSKCFNLTGATSVYFTQGALYILDKAKGPYYLHGFNDEDCQSPQDARDKFTDVDIANKLHHPYKIRNATRAASFMWNLQ
ncbi:hypothetical protein BDU57DRAFT_595294 [Ampelomyces quisqualis]|uniref:Uncharacterized protein n=1 Tax=Ampelomyces quisqualis TaxID=50730 RepID=A0A6A5QM47_AMPQU|nr:hypothetical protein BDU57DRAFT_595294 [Ampelomyces quisqualis]